MPNPPGTPRERDPRLDFFRGIGMFIIFTAHVPGNWLTLWIPARFGFSDATEIFVFCSGMASAIAFGRVFRDRGWPMGTARILHRAWQVYWCHIGLFLAVAMSMAVLNRLTPVEGYDYIGYLNLWPFFEDPAAQLPALMTLTYVPNYFDILPMYLVLLAAIPVVVGIRRLMGVWAALAVVAAAWLATQFGLTGLPAEPWTDRTWFFNPFGWGLVFFTGFAFGSGWLPAPPVRRWLILAAAAFVLLSVPFSYYRILNAVEWLATVHDTYLDVLIHKSEFGILRFVHFLSLAYLAYVAAGEAGRRLRGAGAWGGFVHVVMKVGQQSLAIFVFSMFSARLFGAAVDHIGSGFWVWTAANLSGWLMLVGVAYSVGWFKRQPWRDKPAPKPARSSSPDRAGSAQRATA